MLMKDKENLEIPFMNGNLAYDKGDISETWRMGWLVEYWEKVSLGKEEWIWIPNSYYSLK